MLRPIIKESGLTVREVHLARLANDTFLGLWSFPNVWRDEGIKQNGIGKEVADLIVYFDNTVLIFSDKDIAFPQHKDIKVSWGRWFRSSVLESEKQLRGAEAHIRRSPEKLFLDKKCTEKFPHELDINNLKIHLIAVTFNSYTPSKNYYDSMKPGSSGSLLCSFKTPTNEIQSLPFRINDLNPKKTFIHILDEMTLDLLLKELGNASDFIHYLEAKEYAVRKRNLFFAGGEEDILAHYLQERTVKHRGFGKISFPKTSEYDVIAIPEFEWRLYEQSIEYYRHRELLQKGLPWATVITSMADGILSANVGEGAHLPFLTHERALRFLASENSMSRAVLAEQLSSKYDSVPTDIRSSRCIESLCNPNRLYIFLFLPHNQNETYESHRENRAALMELYALVAKYKFPRITEIVVLATEPKGSALSSMAVMAIDTSIPMDKSDQKFAKQIMLSEKILNHVTSIKSTPKAKATPKKSPTSPPKQGRNSPCSCGSGLKTKKCCS